MKTFYVLLLLSVVSAVQAVDPLIPTNYLKALNSGAFDEFGRCVALSGDTMVVGAPFEAGSKGGVNSVPNDSLTGAGAAYVFVRNGSTWTQQAYLKASNPGDTDLFGISVAISGDTIVVGANSEDSSTTGVNSTPNDTGFDRGAAYVFVRTGTTWKQQAYLKASNSEDEDFFGTSVAISGDTIAVGAEDEDSSATGVNGNQADNSADSAGAVYIFTRTGTTWSQQAYMKASNAQAFDFFGRNISLSGDTLAVAAPQEDSSATGINGNQANDASTDSGAVYVFTRSGVTWSQQAYLKQSNTDAGDMFGDAMALSGDTLVVGAPNEDGINAGVNPATSEGRSNAGAAYVFVRSAGVWTQQAYLKASVTDVDDRFGGAVAVDGDSLVLGAFTENSAASGINGNQSDNSLSDSGAAYYFTRNGVAWSQQAYIKATNPGLGDIFGLGVAVGPDVVIVSADSEDGSGKGTNPESNESANGSGAVYTYDVPLVVSGLAHTGYRAPGGVDLFYGKPGNVAIDPNGDVLFDVALSGLGAPATKNQAEFSSLGGPAVALALQKGTVVGGLLALPATAKIAGITFPVANQTSLGLFQATVSGTGISALNNQVIFTDNGTAVSPILRTGVDKSQLSNLQLKAMYEVLQHPTLNRVVVPYTLGNGSVPANKVAATSDSGLLVTDHSGTITDALLREGSAATGGGGTFGQFAPRAAATANAQTWFIAKFIPTVGATGDAVFDSAARVTVMQGSLLPAIGATAKMGTCIAVSASSSAGIFRSALTGVPVTENEALWSAPSGGAPTLLMQKGKPLPPSSTLKLAKLIRYWPVGSTQVVAHIQVSGTGVTAKNNTALILIQANGQVLFLLRTGDSAPGYPSGALISAISTVDVDPVNGHYAVLATISGVAVTANQALFRGETSLGDDTTLQALRLPKRVLRKGNLYTSPFTPQGSIKGIALTPAVETSGAGARGLRQVINSTGQITVTILGDRSSSELIILDP